MNQGQSNQSWTRATWLVGNLNKKTVDGLSLPNNGPSRQFVSGRNRYLPQRLNHVIYRSNRREETFVLPYQKTKQDTIWRRRAIILLLKFIGYSMACPLLSQPLVVRKVCWWPAKNIRHLKLVRGINPRCHVTTNYGITQTTVFYLFLGCNFYSLQE